MDEHDRRQFIKYVGAWSVGLPSILGEIAHGSRNRPNVVFILSDDHRKNSIGCYGDTHGVTPHLDALAAEGMAFDNACVVSATCTPSRAAMFTGKYPWLANCMIIIDGCYSMNRENSLFPQLFHRHGYEVGYIGKWHLGRGHEPKPEFDYWASFHWVGKMFDQDIHVNGRRVQQAGFTDDNIVKLAVDFIGLQSDAAKPFMLTVALKNPHAPFSYPERHASWTENGRIGKPPTYDEQYDFTAAGKPALEGSALQVDKHPISGLPYYGTWENYTREYYRASRAVDEQVGRIVAALRNSGVLDDTLVLYTTDQGYHLGEHGLTEKHYPYENVINVPLIVRYPPLVPAGKRSSALVSSLDLAPTMMDTCGLPVPGDLQGKSMKPLFAGNDSDAGAFRDAMLIFNHQQANIAGSLSVRTRNWKLITYTKKRKEFLELYNLPADPAEGDNLAYDPAYEGKLSYMVKLRERLKQQSHWRDYRQFPPPGYFVIGTFDTTDEAESFRRRHLLRENEIDFESKVDGRQWVWSETDNVGEILDQNRDRGLYASLFGTQALIGFVAIPVIRQGDREFFTTISARGRMQPVVCYYNGERIYENTANARMENQVYDAGLYHNWHFYHNHPLDAGRNNILLRVIAPGPDYELHLGMTAPVGTLSFPRAGV